MHPYSHWLSLQVWRLFPDNLKDREGEVNSNTFVSIYTKKLDSVSRLVQEGEILSSGSHHAERLQRE